jgi:membrane fusion protein (multidrug efflux system)
MSSSAHANKPVIKSSKAVAITVVIGGIFVVAGGLAAWKYRSISAAMANQVSFEPAEAVDVVAARTVPWAPTAKLVGAIFAIESVSLASEVAGVLAEVKFESGALVEKGDILATFTTQTEEADLAAAKANVRVMEAGVAVAQAEIAATQSQITLAESDERRISQAVESKAAAESTLDKARADLKQWESRLIANRASIEKAKAELEQSKAQVVQLEAMIAKKTLRAPFRARTGIRLVHPGQYLGEGTALVELQSVTDTAYLDFAIPQDQAFRVSAGMKTLVRSSALGEGLIPLTIQAVDSTVDRATRNVRVRTIVDNPGEKLRPGTFVDVEVALDLPTPRVVVPVTAIRRASYGDHVFVITKVEAEVTQPDPATGKPVTTKVVQSRAKQRLVKVGAAIPGSSDMIIESGLQDGEEVAAGGSFKLRDGALLMIDKAGAPPAPDAKSTPAPTPSDAVVSPASGTAAAPGDGDQG